MADVVFAAKEAVYAALREAFRGTKCVVSWADPGADLARRAVWFTETVEPEITATAMVPGRRKPSTVIAEVSIRAVAAESGDPIHAERAVTGLKTAIVDAVLGMDPATVPGLTDLRPVRTLTTNGEHASVGTASQCDVVIRMRARTLS